MSCGLIVWRSSPNKELLASVSVKMVVETEVKPFTILTHMSSIRSLTPFTALDPREHITQAVPELFPLLPFITQHTHIHTPP